MKLRKERTPKMNIFFKLVNAAFHGVENITEVVDH